ncbi:MAG: hypothetical protein GF334_08860, partial [Candidatus Altiarchaeales archaeon]|nr:hypothetical protein [Candidatus Altiarchaeales archaeon]
MADKTMKTLGVAALILFSAAVGTLTTLMLVEEGVLGAVKGNPINEAVEKNKQSIVRVTALNYKSTPFSKVPVENTGSGFI